MVSLIVAFTSHRMNSVILLMLMLLIKAAIICLSTAITLVVAIIGIHDDIRHTARTLVVIHNLRFVILKLIEVGHTTAHTRDFLAARVVVALAMLFPL